MAHVKVGYYDFEGSCAKGHHFCVWLFSVDGKYLHIHSNSVRNDKIPSIADEETKPIGVLKALPGQGEIGYPPTWHNLPLSGNKGRLCNTQYHVAGRNTM